jgi:hypothetical protein
MFFQGYRKYMPPTISQQQRCPIVIPNHKNIFKELYLLESEVLSANPRTLDFAVAVENLSRRDNFRGTET